MTDFINLRNHTQYSLLEGSIPVKKLVSQTVKFGSPAVGITDTNAMFGALEFSTVAAEAGIKPIVGVQVTIKDKDANGVVALYGMNEDGYTNLMRLSRVMYMRESGERYLTLDELAEYSQNVICLTGGPQGPISTHLLNGDDEAAQALGERLRGIYDDRVYVELQRHPDEEGVVPAEEADTEARLLDIAYDLDMPIVATNDARFLTVDDHASNDALLAIGQKASVDHDLTRRRYTTAHHLRSPEDMEKLFADLPEAIENTAEIARRCSYVVPKRAPILPKFADDEATEIRRQAKEGLAARLQAIDAVANVKEYEDRLDFELDVIERMGFPGYFLIVADFIQWAKNNDIPVGPGRGSGAGSLVAYALKITDLDPLRYGLLFERFLNPDRVSMPDFDIDFCMDKREEVIHYVSQKYGADRVGQIITFGGLLTKATIKDVGRVLGMSYNKTDMISKIIPMKSPVQAMGIVESIENEPRLAKMVEEDAEVERLMSLASGVEGLLRNASTHAAGVVISDRPIEELVPVYRDPSSDMPATQFNMKWVEPAGLVKFDFLGLKTLTVINRAEQFIEQSTKQKINTSTMPITDEKTYDLLSKAETVAVFQVESAGMMDALRRMKPDRIEDIVALVALYRPGPMENIPTYCDVKNGKREISSIHPLIDPILEETQGIIVYQEQVMEVARKMAGYTLGGADLLRRAMGKKIAAEMAKERPKFIEGAKKNDITEQKANEVFNLLEKFADYGFNKSHAAAYGVLTYQTAWLKANYPVEFMAAVMDCDITDTKKLTIFKAETDRMGITMVPPSVNTSDAGFSAKDGKIFYALAALKRVGSKAVEPIVNERKNGGPFKDLADFCGRVDLKAVGKGTLEALIEAGALDELEPDRASLFAAVPALVSWSQKKREMSHGPTMDLFADVMEPPKLAKAKAWTNEDRMTHEQKAVGFYLTGHPLDEHLPALRRAGVRTYEEVASDISLDGQAVSIGITVASRKEKMAKSGKKFAYLEASDPSGSFEAMLFGRSLEQFRAALEPGMNAVIQARCEFVDDNLRLSISNVMSLDKALPKTPATGILVRLSSEAALDDVRKAVSPVAPGEPKGTVRVIIGQQDGGEKMLVLGNGAEFGQAARERLSRIPTVQSIAETGEDSQFSVKKAPKPAYLVGNQGVRGGDRGSWDLTDNMDGLVLGLPLVTSVRKNLSAKVLINDVIERPAASEIDIPF